MFAKNLRCPAIFPFDQSNDSEQGFLPSSKHKNDDDRRTCFYSMLIYWIRVKQWIEAGYDVYVFMAIVSVQNGDPISPVSRTTSHNFGESGGPRLLRINSMRLTWMASTIEATGTSHQWK